jgi:hypothetical protein
MVPASRCSPWTARVVASQARAAAGTTLAGPALSAIESGSRKRSQYRESTTSSAGNTSSVAAMTPAKVVKGSIRRPSRKAISGSIWSSAVRLQAKRLHNDVGRRSSAGAVRGRLQGAKIGVSECMNTHAISCT